MMQKRHQLDFQENLHAQNYELMADRSGEIFQVSSNRGKERKRRETSKIGVSEFECVIHENRDLERS